MFSNLAIDMGSHRATYYSISGLGWTLFIDKTKSLGISSRIISKYFENSEFLYLSLTISIALTRYSNS